tara:strand:- start:3040 stop:3291 length:252 start_codon:yes stop_codon:yes gene_type:complete
MRDRYENKESDIQDINKILMVYREESQRLNQVIKENVDNYDTMLELEWVDRVIKTHERELIFIKELYKPSKKTYDSSYNLPQE